MVRRQVDDLRVWKLLIAAAKQHDSRLKVSLVDACCSFCALSSRKSSTKLVHTLWALVAMAPKDAMPPWKPQTRWGAKSELNHSEKVGARTQNAATSLERRTIQPNSFGPQRHLPDSPRFARWGVGCVSLARSAAQVARSTDGGSTQQCQTVVLLQAPSGHLRPMARHVATMAASVAAFSPKDQRGVTRIRIEKIKCRII